MDWRLVTEFFASVGYGVLSSFIPVFNSEVYIVATQALGLTAELSAALGVAVGQMIGKTSIVFALRHGTKLPWLQRRVAGLQARMAKPEGDDRPPGRVRLFYRTWSKKLLGLVSSRWGLLIVYLSGAAAVPPMLAVQFVVPATSMRLWKFALVVLLGRCTLFLLVVFGVSAIVERLF